MRILTKNPVTYNIKGKYKLQGSGIVEAIILNVETDLINKRKRFLFIYNDISNDNHTQIMSDWSQWYDATTLDYLYNQVKDLIPNSLDYIDSYIYMVYLGFMSEFALVNDLTINDLIFEP